MEIPKTRPDLLMVAHGKPVSVNHAYGQNGKRRFLTKDAQAWKSSIAEAFRDAQMAHDYVPIDWGNSVLVYLGFWGVNADIDNLLKVTLDGIKECIGVDDRFYEVWPEYVTGFADAGAIIRIWSGDQRTSPVIDRRVVAARLDSLHRDAMDVRKRLGCSMEHAQTLLTRRPGGAA
jgi:hypothetical protein